MLSKKIQKIIGKGKPKFGEIPMRKDEIVTLYPSIKKDKKIHKMETSYFIQSRSDFYN